MYKNVLSRTILGKSVSLLKCSVENVRQVHCGVCLRNPRQTPKPNTRASPAITTKYQVITDSNATVIENTAEEIHHEHKYPIFSDEFDGINLASMKEHGIFVPGGKSGVFEIEDLVVLLQRENSKDIFVATVPQNINYVDYICVVTARSKRHILALAEFVRRVYKKKCFKTDLIPKIEGKDSEEWMALDLGNIALHIFSEKARSFYDLDNLWAVGPDYDEQMKKKHDVADIFQNYSAYLKDLKPL